MPRAVGTQNRSEFELDPVLALRRAFALDAQMASTREPWPRGVLRAPHRVFNALDDERALATARRLNPPKR